MNNDNKRRQGAERLFGALSGVDEEYLAACEKDRGGRGSSPGRIMFFAQKYGKAAAVLGIAVLGIGLLGLQAANSSIFPEKSMMYADRQRNESNSMSGGAAQQEMAEAMEEGIAAEPAEGVPGQQGSNLSSELADDASQPENGRSDVLETNRQDDTDSSVDKYKTEGVGSEAATVKDTALTLAAARETAVVGSYLPSVLPKEGELAWVTRETLAGQEQAAICWNYPDGKGSFLWTVRNLGEEEPDWTEKLPAGQSVLEGADMTRKDMQAWIGDALQSDGGIVDGSLCIYYLSDGNYILLEYQGNCDADILWAMLGSVG